MDIKEEIKKLKAEKNAIILTHCYQNIEIDDVSDFVGDSLYLSKAAANTDAEIIVFAGVYFMAQSAKLLSPEKKVLLPNMNSGCLMADMIDVEGIRKFKADHTGIPVVCYINSTAEVKAECDICCTSSNAIEIIKSLNTDKVLFVPDTYLGKWAEYKLKDVEVITYNGFCPTHLRIRPEDIEKARKEHPGALILVHPECHREVSKLADFVGSTKEITDFAMKSEHKKFVIVTEEGVTQRLIRDNKLNNGDKEFVSISDKMICPNMKRNTLEDIRNVLLTEQNEITIDEDVQKKAKECIERMMSAGSRK